jgi:hypothetical protein
MFRIRPLIIVHKMNTQWEGLTIHQAYFGEILYWRNYVDSCSADFILVFPQMKGDLISRN